MKKNRWFGLALVATMFGASFSACSNEAEEVLAQESEIKLTSEITPSRVTSLDYQSEQIVKGQQVGVTIAGAKSEHKNVAWTVGTDGALTNTDDAVYYSGNNTATITAYHPYNSTWTGTSHTFSVSKDQSDEANYRNSDLLWATASSSKTEKAVGLIFAHKLAKVNVTLTSTDITDLNGATISICGTNIATNFNPSTGELSAAVADVQEIKAGVTTEEAFTASAIVVPQTVANGTKFIKVIHGSKTFYYTLTADKVLKSGYSHNYTLTVKEKELEIATESDKITDWTDENGNIGDAEEEVVIAKTVTVETAGTLSTLISEKEKNKITSLTISGSLNSADVLFIREMAGSDVNGNETEGKLKELDMNNATTVAGGGHYYSYNSIVCECADNTEHISYMFAYCKLQNITLPKTVGRTGKAAFANCTNLQSLIIPNSLTHIDDYAFSGCSNMTSLTLSNNIELIHGNAFEYCSKLTSLEFPSSLNQLGSYVFKGCSSLTSIKMNNSTAPTITSETFEGFNQKECTLYIPKSSAINAYGGDWVNFGTIEKF